APREHLHRVDRIDRDARLGILVGLDAVVVRNDIDDAEYEWKIGTSGRRHGTASFAVPGFYTVRALASMIPARLTSATCAATRRCGGTPIARLEPARCEGFNRAVAPAANFCLGCVSFGANIRPRLEVKGSWAR